MKKYLIALPLVLIMILSMVPVMAADEHEIQLPWTIYGEPDKTGKEIKGVQPLTVPAEIARDKAKFEALVTEKLEKILEANRPDDRNYTIKATVVPSEEVDAVMKDVTVADALKIQGVTNADPALENEKVLTAAAWEEIQKTPRKLKAEDIMPADPTDVKKAQVVLVAASYTEPTAEGEMIPKSITGEEPVWCPERCEYIRVLVINAFTKDVVEGLTRSYKVDPEKLPTFDGIVNHFEKNYLLPNDYQYLRTWKGTKSLYLPVYDEDCTILIYALPLFQDVNVLHILQDCCEKLDGTQSWKVTNVFYERDVRVDFIKYHSELMIDNSKAKEFATTRLQKINATDYVFDFAEFDDGINLDGYMTGEVLDMNGNKVATITNGDPVIRIFYKRAECVKEEEQVDNATVENNTNTQAPVTASGTQLPATGAKDVTAFFLSAVALLGLGIFFAKKH